MKHFFASAVVAAALMVPATAYAATQTDIFVDDTYSVGDTLFPSGTVRMDFTAQQDLQVVDFAVNGLGDSADIANVTFEISENGTVTQSGSFDTISTVTGALSIGSTALVGLRMDAGDVLTVLFIDGIVEPVGVTTTLNTAQVPLPAAGGMLLTGLIAAGVVGRRKKKKAD